MEQGDECRCPAGDRWRCVRGVVFGPCDDPGCPGDCEEVRPCWCPCHQEDDGGVKR